MHALLDGPSTPANGARESLSAVFEGLTGRAAGRWGFGGVVKTRLRDARAGLRRGS